MSRLCLLARLPAIWREHPHRNDLRLGMHLDTKVVAVGNNNPVTDSHQLLAILLRKAAMVAIRLRLHLDMVVLDTVGISRDLLQVTTTRVLRRLDMAVVVPVMEDSRTTYRRADRMGIMARRVRTSFREKIIGGRTRW